MIVEFVLFVLLIIIVAVIITAWFDVRRDRKRLRHYRDNIRK